MERPELVQKLVTAKKMALLSDAEEEAERLINEMIEAPLQPRCVESAALVETLKNKYGLKCKRMKESKANEAGAVRLVPCKPARWEVLIPEK